MSFSASTFIRGRKSITSITDNRIKHVLWYILECHRIFLNDNITYSLKEIKNTTKIKPEDYFRTKFVDNYLRKNRGLLQSFQMEDIFFGKEEVEIYEDNSGIKQEDKIDIYVRDASLQKYWSNEGEVYFAIECKRIKQLSDSNIYISDIDKFCKRNYTNLRLPFVGQIAFIENTTLSHDLVAIEINSYLKKSTSIITDKYLSNIKLHSTIDCSYHSLHKKNFLKKESFLIYHLLFNYSSIVTD